MNMNEKQIRKYNSTLYAAISKAVKETMDSDCGYQSEIFMDTKTGEVFASNLMTNNSYLLEDEVDNIKSLCFVEGWYPSDYTESNEEDDESDEDFDESDCISFAIDQKEEEVADEIDKNDEEEEEE